MLFYPKALKFPSPLYNLKFFPKGFDKLPPGGGGTLYAPGYELTKIEKGARNLREVDKQRRKKGEIVKNLRKDREIFQRF